MKEINPANVRIPTPQRVTVKRTPEVVAAIEAERKLWVAMVPEEWRADISAKLTDGEIARRLIVGKRAPKAARPLGVTDVR